MGTAGKTITAHPARTAEQWSGKSRGGYWGNRFFVALIKYVGVWPAYIWLVPVALYFTLMGGGQVQSSLDYLRRRLENRLGRFPRIHVFRHFISSGVTLIDRAAVIMGTHSVQYHHDGEEILKDCIRDGSGAILLCAHLGAWEMGGHALEHYQRPVNIVMLDREARAVSGLFAKALNKRHFQILTADADPLRSIPILNALRRGELVAMHGDRIVEGDTATVRFLNDRVRLPIGPYILGAYARVPVLPVFCVREKLGVYHFLARQPFRLEPKGRTQMMDAVNQCAQIYADYLEDVSRLYPYQWYNFYPYWTGKGGHHA